MMSSSESARSCTPKSVRLNVLSAVPPAGGPDSGRGAGAGRGRNAWQSGHGTIAHSKAGKWRAAVLILVHVLIAAHIVQWMITGMTLSPVEPSESMQTLREGAVNAGFVMFALAIVSTAVLGRWFCGWACHVVALQDLCAWMMMKLGVKPKPFRSRLLLWAPLLVALYMFVWPVFHREIIRPLFGDRWGRLPVWLGQSDPLPTIRAEFLVQDFWATFPAWYTAIPFFIIIGFACVYFLGSKGFCTYGCPYGGFFAPIDRVAVGRIRVNDDCNQCGHCTAVCTSNVRVHEEVRDFGTVMDPGCMKCMDCVTVCPNDALRFGMGAPAVLTRPRDGSARERAAKARASREARYDLTRREEWVFAAVFLAILLAYRGFLNEVPLLMAVGIAGVGTFLLHKCWRMVREPSVRMVNLQLKAKGRMFAAGWAVGVSALILTVVGAWSGMVRYHTWRAGEMYAAMTVPLSAVFRPEFEASATQRALASRIVDAYTRADRWGTQGGRGIGWGLNPDQRLNLAYALCVLDRTDAAEAEFLRVVRTGRPRDGLVFQTAQLMQFNGREPDAIRGMLRDALAGRPELDQVRASLNAENLAQASGSERTDAVLATWNDRLNERHLSAGTYLAAAGNHFQARRIDRGNELLGLAVTAAVKRHDADALLQAARMQLAQGEAVEAERLVGMALDIRTNRGHRAAAAAGIFMQMGDRERAAELSRLAIDKAEALGPHSGQAGVFVTAANLLAAKGDIAEAARMFKRAADAVGYSAWDVASIGLAMAQTAQSVGGAPAAQGDSERARAIRALLDGAVAALESACAIEPDASTLRHDLAQVYLAAGRVEDSVKSLEQAANTGASNPELAGRMAQLLGSLGRADEANRWVDEARRRAAQIEGASRQP